MWLDHLLSREFFGRVERVQTSVTRKGEELEVSGLNAKAFKSERKVPQARINSIRYKTDISEVEADEVIQFIVLF